MTTVLINSQPQVPQTFIDALEARFQGVWLPTAPAERERFLAERSSEFTVLVTSVATGVDAALMDALPNLEAIANFGVGYDSTDVDAATERGIKVSNTPEVLDDCVADLAVGLMIDVMRAVSASDRYTRAGGWLEKPYPLQRRVTGAKVGILGMGRIGTAIVERLVGFRCEIGYHNRNEVPGSLHRYFPDAAALANWCDVLVVATPGGSATRALVDTSVLNALGPDGFLVNIARGTVVDEPALVTALTNGTIAGAGLDVFADEPNVPKELFALDNVVLIPHVASATHETREAMGDLVIDNVAAWLERKTLVTPVN